MSSKYLGKYRSETARAGWWDYGWNGAYFVTICTQDKVRFFGEVVNTEMVHSPEGVLADALWTEIPIKFDGVALDAFVVMPNHVHGILILDRPNAIDRLPTEPKKEIGGVTRLKNPMMYDNVSSIVRWYKGRCSFEIRKKNALFSWQSRFYDHIIRNEMDFQRIVDYINNNTLKWGAR